MSEEFQTVLNIDNLGGGKSVIQTETKLSQEALTMMMQGPNQMGPGMHRDAKDAAQPQGPAVQQP